MLCRQISIVLGCISNFANGMHQSGDNPWKTAGIIETLYPPGNALLSSRRTVQPVQYPQKLIAACVQFGDNIGRS